MVVVNWNGISYLRSCLDSLIGQDYKNFDIWFVDNASSDDSVDFVKRNYPRVKVIRNSRNLGFAAACNIAIRKSTADAIALLNNDAAAAPNWLSELARAMEKDNSIGIAGGPIFFDDSKDVLWFSGARIDGLTGLSWNLGQFDRRVVDSEVDALSGCAMIIKSSLLRKTGGLDENYFMYTEDLDICLDAKRRGLRLAFIPSAIVWHKVGGSGGNIPSTVYYLKLRSDLRFALKNLRWWSLPLVPFVHGFLVTAIDTLSGKIPRDGGPLLGLRALGWNLANLHSTMRKRNKINSRFPNPLKVRVTELASTTIARVSQRKQITRPPSKIHAHILNH